MIHNLNTSPCRPNKNQLEPKTVFTTRNFLLAFIVISRCSEMSENHLRDPNIIFRMFYNINPISIINHRNNTRFFINTNVNIFHRETFWFSICDLLLHSNILITCIYNPFIETFIKTGDPRIGGIFNLCCFGIERPILYFINFNRTNICIRGIQDMFAISFLLVCCR